jgi:uncharacterized phage-associated protein
MANMYDVARYILQKQGSMSAMKLQKLMYYSQAWHLVWEENELFSQDFQAWANGPVIPELYNVHRGLFRVDAATFQGYGQGSMTAEEEKNVDKVLSFYGDKSAQWLSDLTHQESPWLEARGHTPIGEPSSALISKSAMMEYYLSL